MPAPRLLLVTDSARMRLPLLELAAESTAGGVDAIYLRHMTPHDDWATTLGQIRECVAAEVLLMVPGTPPAGVPGTGQHLRERDAFPERSRLDDAHPLSRSVHSPLEAARSHGVDYVVAGHVFPTSSKPDREPIGLGGLTSIATAAPCPAVAIGGITPELVASVIVAGASGVAVIGAICDSRDPRSAARGLRAAVDASLEQRAKGPHMETTQTSEPMVVISVNGKPREVAAGATVHELLAGRKLADSMAIVERNGIILPREAYATTVLAAGDNLEVVHAVGGG